jgi:hypothetical protein
VNDTRKWLLLRTFVGSSSLTVNLYGTPQRRRVESEVAPLSTVGNPPTTWRKDPTLTKGRKVVVSAGTPPRSTRVHRRDAPNGDSFTRTRSSATARRSPRRNEAEARTKTADKPAGGAG